jgi:D-tyrosyl-tRNA(Tyr) deacylase
MRAIIQRVNRAQVSVNEKVVGAIGNGLLVFLAVHVDDEDIDLDYIVKKTMNLRIFPDANDKMNLSVIDVDGEILVVSQFTLYGDLRSGNRPSFVESAGREKAILYYEAYQERLRKQGIPVESGVFGAKMEVTLLNSGPVTIQLDSRKIY